MLNSQYENLIWRIKGYLDGKELNKLVNTKQIAEYIAEEIVYKWLIEQY